MRRLVLCAALLAGVAGQAIASSFPFSGIISVSTGEAQPANTMRLVDKTGSGITNYPLQFGRPFLPGAIPHFPEVLLNGAAVPTQADVKNRWPDGSVKFAVLAVVVSTIPAGGSVAVSFQDSPSGNNAAMTTAQMAAMLPSDATMQIDTPASVGGSVSLGLAQWQAISNGSFCVSVDGAAAVCPVIDFTKIVYPTGPGVYGAINAALKAMGLPLFVYLDPGGYSATIQTTAIGAGHTLSVTSPQPGSSGTDIAGSLGLQPSQATTQPGNSTTVSALAMLNAGACSIRLVGPIAQMVMCADDTAAASFDVGAVTVKGAAGLHKPLRPRFYLTFWPGVSKVLARYVGDGSKTTDVMDMRYQATLGLDSTPVYTLDLLGANYVASCSPALVDYGAAVCYRKHWYGSTWTKTFWQGGAPPKQIDIDANLPYLASTRFVPNFNTSITIDPTALNNFYTGWLAAHNEPYDGGWDGGIYTNVMSQVGGRMELGPYPVWANDWLYTGAWQMREMSERMADLAGAFPMQFRETQAGKRLLRTDASGVSTGLGLPFSVTDHTKIATGNQSLLIDQSYPASRLTFIGPVDYNAIWTYDNGHLPDPYYVPYLLTGDPYYADQNEMWASYVALNPNGQSTNYYAGRGPTGAEGGISGDATRANGWSLRQRAEAAFIAPDFLTDGITANPEKTYLTMLTNDALARWEGVVNITGTPYQTQPAIVGSQGASYNKCATDCNLWTWGHVTGNHEAPQMPATSISPLHMWESYCNPASPCDASPQTGAPGSTFTAGVGSDQSPWMQNYFLYGLLRARELGFAAAPLAKWLLAADTGLILDSGTVTANGVTVNAAIMSSLYRMPTARTDTLTWMTIWSDVAAHIEPGYMTGTGPSLAYPGGLPGYFAFQSTQPNYYTAAFYAALAMGADLDTRAPAAFSWLSAKMPRPYLNGPNGTNDPRYYFAPRVDTNVLPAIPPN